MSKIVELNSRDINSIMGGVYFAEVMSKRNLAALIVFGGGNVISNYINRGCRDWKETLWPSKTACYVGNGLMEGVFHAILGHGLLDILYGHHHAKKD